METAKVFTNGRSQAVRLPKNCRFDTGEVYVKKIDDFVLLIPKKDIWKNWAKALEEFSPDFMENRDQPGLQERNAFK